MQTLSPTGQNGAIAENSFTESDWRDAVEKALKGAAFETLISKTDDTISIRPLYQSARDAVAQAGRATGTRWRITQRIDHPNPAEANRLALGDLAGGADALDLVFADSASAFGYGLRNADTVMLKTALSGVFLDGIHIRLSPGPHGSRVAPAFAETVVALGYAPSSIDVDFGLDPIGALATRGDLAERWSQVAPRIAALISDLKSRGFTGRFLSADGRPYHGAGATEAQELAAVLATGIAYLRALEAAGIELDEAAAAIGFAVAVDADQFLGIAKVRALRRLWSAACQACGLEAPVAHIHAETSWRMMTRRDPWVNMLRTTVAAFAAGIGGVNSLSVLPFTAALGLPDGFARRVARNTQTMLLEETNLYRVADPAAGSGFVETLTEDLAAEAWAGFQEIERAGGIVAALTEGSLQRRISEARAKRRAAIEKRRKPITGTSEFPNIAEKPVITLPVAPWPAAQPHADAALRIEPLPQVRLAEPFEALRDASEAHAAKTGTAPRAFMANLGRIADFTTRSTWMKNLFEAGGIEAPGNDGFTDVSTVARAFRDSGAGIACLCSSDAVYAEMAADVARALKEAGAAHVVLAGRPGDQEDALRSAGVDGFVFAGRDIITALQEAQDAIGVARKGSAA